MYMCNYTLEFAICCKNMELLKLYSKKKTNFFWLNQVAIYLMLMLALRLFLKDKGGKQHCLMPFVGSNMGVETFFKKRGHQKRVR